jgi:hypothetical protein
MNTRPVLFSLPPIPVVVILADHPVDLLEKPVPALPVLEPDLGMRKGGWVGVEAGMEESGGRGQDRTRQGGRGRATLSSSIRQTHLPLGGEPEFTGGRRLPQPVHDPQVGRRHGLDLGEVDPPPGDGRGARQLNQAGPVLMVRRRDGGRRLGGAERGPVNAGLGVMCD